MPQVVAGLKQSQASILLACSLGEGFFENTWIPAAHDGVFYTENALDKYLENRVNSGFEVSFLLVIQQSFNHHQINYFKASHWLQFV